MKNIFKILALIMPLFAVSCVDSLIEENPSPDMEVKETVTLTLRMGPDSKTFLYEDKYVCWEDGDVIYINDSRYPIILDEQYANLAYVENVPVADCYIAYYAQSLYALGENEFFLNLPTQQSYREGTFAQFANPMVAVSASTDLEFFNAASVLKLGIKGESNLTSVSIKGNNGEALSGNFFATYDSVIDYENFTGMELYSENSGYNFVSVSLPDTLKLSETPQYIYAVIAPGIYEKGITVTLEDDKGRVCVQSTSKSITANRAEILDMAEFTFTEAEAMGVSDIVPAATSVSYNVSAKANSAVTSVVVFKSAWDEYLAGSFKERGEVDLAEALLSAYGIPTQVGADGKVAVTDTSARNYNGSLLRIMGDTDYKLLVSYASGYESVGKVIVNDFKSAEAAGAAPEITLTVNKVEKRKADISLAVSDDAISVAFAVYQKSTYDKYAEAGFTAEDMLKLDGSNAEKEFNLVHNQLYYDKSYVIFAMAVGAQGKTKVVENLFTTDSWYDPAAEWEAYTTTAVMDCALSSTYYFLDIEHTAELKNLVVDKMVGKDIFRVKNLPTTFCDKMDDVLGDEYRMFDDVDGYWYIDATNPDKVVVPFVTEFTLGGSDIYYYTMTETFPENDYAYGTYDKTTGVIDLGDLLMHQPGDSHYIVQSRSYLYLNGK